MKMAARKITPEEHKHDALCIKAESKFPDYFFWITLTPNGRMVSHKAYASKRPLGEHVSSRVSAEGDTPEEAMESLKVLLREKAKKNILP